MVWRSGAGDYMSFQSGARIDSGGGRRGAASFGFWPRESRGDSRDTRDTGGYLSFCMGPKESVAKAVQQPNLGLCGIQGHSGRDQEHEFKVLRLPRCGHCTAPDNGVENFETELSFPSSDKGVGTTVAQRNVQTAKSVICEVYRDLERRCHEERRQYEESGTQPSQQKLNFWSTYTNKARLQHFTSESVAFVQKNPECRSRLSHPQNALHQGRTDHRLTGKQLRFLVLLQHLVSEDSLDVTRPERLRKHQDVFEGVLTDSISSQLVEDAHRCEFSIEGRSFSLQDVLQLEGQQEERKKRIAQFQSELVHALETYLLSFCARKGLSPGGSKRLMQAVTTQMSQAGLANIDRGSEASRYFVGSQGLDQRIAYNLSTMYVHDQEALKLSIVCMRTGFTQYLDKDELLHLAGVQYPRRCKPDSYLYQYATLCFTIGPPVENSESIECSVLDALDEAQINAALGEDEEEVILDEAQLQVT